MTAPIPRTRPAVMTQNKAHFYAKAFPDENYAREVMQLFSIGLYHLNDDGSKVLDKDSGDALETYTNDDIMTFSKVWTGFDVRPMRINIEDMPRQNFIDPMRINPAWRDRTPKTKLDEGYIGDHYPLCKDLPPRHFLRAGSHYRLTGRTSAEGSDYDGFRQGKLPGTACEMARKKGSTGGFSSWYSAKAAGRSRFRPKRGSSALYAALCAPLGKTGACTFPDEVTLTKDLPCDGVECPDDLGNVRVVKIIDSEENKCRTMYYQYIPPPCVRLALHASGKQTYSKDAGEQTHSKDANTYSAGQQCADPAAKAAGAMCCRRDAAGRSLGVVKDFGPQCRFANEVRAGQTEAGNAPLSKRSAALAQFWSSDARL